MSPPCQPFTRNGNQKDVEDARTSSFLHILKILPHIKNLQFILLENVMGFEKSVARDNLITVLQNNNFNIREYLRSPKWVGVPNSRMRYYCLANKNNNGMQLKHQIQVTIFLKLRTIALFAHSSLFSLNQKQKQKTYLA